MKRFLPVLLSFLLVPVFQACDSGSSGSATVTGTVTNTFSAPLQGATVAFGRTCTDETSETGEFTCDVDPDTYEVTVTVPGYNTLTFTVEVDGDGEITVPPITGAGNVDASIVNSVTGAAINGAALVCKRLLPSGEYSQIEYTGATTAAGRFIAQGLFTGTAACIIGTGTSALPINFEVTTNTAGTIGATPVPTAGQYRIVLSWGENPRDLDSHLTGPDGSGGRYHVYYSNETAGQTNLDLDDTSSFGPETTTLVPTGNGMYRFSVHNYSTQGSTGAAGIATSPATVRVYNSTGLIRTYVAPAPSAANGGNAANTWKVFEMTIAGTNATFAGATPAGIGYVTASSSSDTSTFLTGGGVFEDIKATTL